MTMDFANPLETPEAWDSLVLGGVTFNGTFEFSGDVLKKRLDRRHAPGRSGARVVSRGYDLAEITLTLQCWEPTHFEELQSLIGVLFPRDAREGTASNGAVTCSHPALAQAGILTLYAQSASMLSQKSPGLWEQSFKLVEYRPEAQQARRSVTRRVRVRPDIAANRTAFTGLQEATAPLAPTPPSQGSAAEPD